jgi:hypothetical protein
VARADWRSVKASDGTAGVPPPIAILIFPEGDAGEGEAMEIGVGVEMVLRMCVWQETRPRATECTVRYTTKCIGCIVFEAKMGRVHGLGVVES